MRWVGTGMRWGYVGGAALGTRTMLGLWVRGFGITAINIQGLDAYFRLDSFVLRPPYTTELSTGYLGLEPKIGKIKCNIRHL